MSRVKKDITEFVATFLVREAGLAMAELSQMQPDAALEYLKWSQLEFEENQKIFTQFQASDCTYFFNYMHVPRQMRKKGVGSLLLKEVIEYCNQKNIFLINSVSNYGAMGQGNLIEFYRKQGCQLIHENGLMIYAKNLPQLPQTIIPII